MSVIGKYGPTAIGQEQFEQEQALLVQGADRYGAGAIGSVNQVNPSLAPPEREPDAEADAAAAIAGAVAAAATALAGVALGKLASVVADITDARILIAARAADARQGADALYAERLAALAALAAPTPADPAPTDTPTA